MSGDRYRFGFMWNCPWRIQWRRECEYWFRYQFGPFYVLEYYNTSGPHSQQEHQ